MNILVFVMSLLMMLSLMTYARLDMYRNFMITQGEFERYMIQNEREAFNSGAQQWYDWTSLTEKNGGSKIQAPHDASPKLGIQWLLNPEIRQKNLQSEPAQREMFKNLLLAVFENQPEFKKAIDKNPQVVSDLIQAIEAAGQRLANEKKQIKSTDGLENLDLENPALQDLYYWMLKGYHPVKLPKDRKKSLLQKKDKENGEREESSDNQSEEHIHQEGTISLLDYVTVNPQKTKVRVFLAPRALLQAIFGDSHTVDDIMRDRLELYRQVKNEQETRLLSEQFKERYASRAFNIPESLLDFTVTGSNPRLYEVQ